MPLTKRGSEEKTAQMSELNRVVPSRVLLSPQRLHNEAMLNNGSGVFCSSTPPLSRQRRHSKLHLRVASEISVDQDSGSQSTVTKDRYRIVMMGSSAVGKTAIVEQFLYGSFPTNHSATVEELHKGEYEVGGGGVIPLEIIDTSGSFEFPAMRRLAICTGDAFALIYSINDSESFEEVKRLRETILQVKGDVYCPIVVVGNKSDLAEDMRAVMIELAECQCIDWDLGFVECSAKTNQNIINIFSSMLIQARLHGCLNVNQILASNSSKHHSSHHPRDQSSGPEGIRTHHQRRRSSLPISELFHRSPAPPITGLSQQQNRERSFRKRNSCTPS